MSDLQVSWLWYTTLSRHGVISGRNYSILVQPKGVLHSTQRSSLSPHPRQSTKILSALALPQSWSLWQKQWLLLFFQGYLLMIKAAWCRTQVIRCVSNLCSSPQILKFLFSKDRILALGCEPAAVIAPRQARGGSAEPQGQQQSWGCLTGTTHPPIKTSFPNLLQVWSHFRSPNTQPCLLERE